jgi:hypothetical protein
LTKLKRRGFEIENTNINVNENQVLDTDVEGGATYVEKKLTQEDFDKAISKRLAREKAKWEKEFAVKLEIEKKESEELAKLSEAEKQKKLFEKQVKEFEETKRAFENERLLNETSKQLASKSLPIEFAEMLKGNDAEKTFENIQLFEAKFNEAVEKVVTERLRGNVPKTTTSLNSPSITKEQFNKMDLAQRQKLFNDNRDLYNELSK